ncbi:MAG TPA: hypothetical protein VGD56_14115 [Gemmatirosa sp.]
MLPIAILALLLVGATGFAVASVRALAPRHGTLDVPWRRQFLSEFDRDGLPANVLVEAFEALGRRTAGFGQRVRKSADLATDLGLSAADVEDIALLVVARCDGALPTAADLNALDRSVRTVGDLVRFLAPFCVAPGSGRARLALMA